jgi:hypothetical protein
MFLKTKRLFYDLLHGKNFYDFEKEYCEKSNDEEEHCIIE